MTSWVDPVEPTGSFAQGAHEHADDEQRQGRQQQQRADDVDAGEAPPADVEPLGHERQPGDDGAEREPARQRILVASSARPATRPPRVVRSRTVADAATSHVATSTTSNPGDLAPAA